MRPEVAVVSQLIQRHDYSSEGLE
jgi:hypothetical protein